MIKGIESITIFSENARKLADFYKLNLGLEVEMEAEMDDNEEAFIFKKDNGSQFSIVDHSEVRGKNKEPERIIINFEVENIEEETKKLNDTGIKKIKDIYHIEGYGLVATFEDLDGNYFQLVQIRPN